MQHLRRNEAYKVAVFPWRCYGSIAPRFSHGGHTLPNICPCCLPVNQSVNKNSATKPKHLLYPQWNAGLHTSALHLQENEKEPRRISVWWTKFANNVRMFAVGTKNIYHDAKLMNEYRRKHGKLKLTETAPRVTDNGKTTILYSRKELQFSYRVCCIE